MGNLDDLLANEKKKKPNQSENFTAPVKGRSNLDSLISTGIKDVPIQEQRSQESQVAPVETKPKKNIFQQAGEFIQKIKPKEIVSNLISSIKGNVEEVSNSFVKEFGIQKKNISDVVQGKMSYSEWNRLATTPVIQKEIEDLKTKQSQKFSEKNQKEIDRLQGLINNTGNDPISIIKRSNQVQKIMKTRTQKNLAAGFLESTASLADSVSWLSSIKNDAIQGSNLPKPIKDIENFKSNTVNYVATKTSDKIKSWAEELKPESPEFMDQLSQGVGSSITFFLPGLGVAKGSSVLAKVSPKVALFFGSSASTALEAMSEAGSVYKENLDSGKSKKEANESASKTFWANSVLIGITNKLGIFGDNAKVLKKLLLSSGFEGFQEYAQQSISNVNTGREWDEGTFESGIIGAIIGGGLSNFDVDTKDQKALEPILQKVTEKEAIVNDEPQIPQVITEEMQRQSDIGKGIEPLGKETSVFRGALDQTLDVTRANGITGGVSFSLDEDVAKRFADKENGTVKAYTISPDARVINHSYLEEAVKDLKGEEKTKAVKQILEQNKIDVIRFDLQKDQKGEAELRVVNEKVLKESKVETPKQVSESKESNLLFEEARKYKTADEFVKNIPDILDTNDKNGSLIKFVQDMPNNLPEIQRLRVEAEQYSAKAFMGNSNARAKQQTIFAKISEISQKEKIKQLTDIWNQATKTQSNSITAKGNPPSPTDRGVTKSKSQAQKRDRGVVENEIKIAEESIKNKITAKLQATEDALGQIWMELEVAEPGQRIRVENPNSSEPTILGISSTFPSWVSDDLRSSKLFGQVMSSLVNVVDNPTYPSGNTPRLRALFDEIMYELDNRVGLNISEEMSVIMKGYEEIASLKKKVPPSPKRSKEKSSKNKEIESVNYEDILRLQIGDTFDVVKPVGDLWKPKNNTIFIRPKRDNPSYATWLRNKNFISDAKEAGNGIYLVKIKTEKTTPNKTNGSPRGYASTGVFAELENLTQKLESNKLKIVEFPELVRMAETLMGKRPTATSSKRGKYLGLFTPAGKGAIQLKTEIFENPDQAAKVLAHEIGHLADYLPEGIMTRGNLVGRVAVLLRNLKQIYGNLDNKVIRKELGDLSAKWRPVPKGKGTIEDLKGDKYRMKPAEMYADAISVLFNDPVRLKQEAPEFWKGFFQYLDKKPSVKENFNAIWDLLNKGEEAVYSERDKSLNSSFQKGEEAFVAKILEKEKRKTSLMYNLKLLFDDVNTPIKVKIDALRKQGKDIPAELNPDYALKGLLYSDAKLRNYIRRSFQPVFAKAQEVENGWEKLGKLLFYERVVKERGKLANPQGYNPKTAQDQLNTMERLTPPEEWVKLQEAKVLMRSAVEKSIEFAERNEYYTPELLAQMKANPAYASFQVVDYLDTYITARVYQQKGTLKDIANPATSTVMKLISLHKSVERNNAKIKNVEFLKSNFPDSIQDAKTKWNGKAQEIVDPKDPDFELVITIEEGKAKGYYIEKDVANMLNKQSNRAIELMASVSRTISQSKFYRPLFTMYNLGFQSFNFVRDIRRAWKNMPQRNLSQIPLSPIIDAYIVGKGYIKAVKPSIARALDKENQIIQEMEDAKILGLSYNDMFSGEVDPEQKQVERILEDAHILKKSKKFGLFRPISATLEAIETLGNFIETLPKVAGYIQLKGTMPQEELAEFIRSSIGSPAFRVGGLATPVSNNIFMFSNAIKEGIKTDLAVATGKKGKATSAAFWYKTVLSDFTPKIIMYMIAAGLFGEWMKKIMDGVTEYDKTNYTIIPLGLDEKGKSIYMRIPHDETGRFLSAIFWKSMNINKDSDMAKSLFEIFSFGAGQFPSLSPSFTGISALVTYLSGNNPYDSFRNRFVIPDTEFKAGVKHSLPIFLDWLAKNQGTGIIFPTYKPDSPTDLEKILTAPILSNIVGRWVKVSDYGQTERLKKVSEKVEAQDNQKKLNERKVIDEALRSYKKDPSFYNKSNLEAKIVKDLVPDGDKEKTNRLIKKFRIGIIRGQRDPELNSLIDAGSNAEKVELLLAMKKTLSTPELNRVISIASEEKIISKDVIESYNNKK